MTPRVHETLLVTVAAVIWIILIALLVMLGGLQIVHPIMLIPLGLGSGLTWLGWRLLRGGRRIWGWIVAVGLPLLAVLALLGLTALLIEAYDLDRLEHF